jgi:hypothetical protein
MSADVLMDAVKIEESLTNDNIDMLLNLIVSGDNQKIEENFEFPMEYDWSQPAKVN